MATYKYPGEVITVTAGANITTGDVISLATRVGVALDTVKSGANLSVSVTGVYEIDKTASLAIDQGDAVYFNTTSKKITKTNTDVPAGWAVADAAAADGSVLVKIG